MRKYTYPALPGHIMSAQSGRPDANDETATVGSTYRYGADRSEWFDEGETVAFSGIHEEVDGDNRIERDFIVKENGLVKVEERFYESVIPLAKQTKKYYLDADGNIESTGQSIEAFCRDYHFESPAGDVREARKKGDKD